ncbi:AfsR/SARP family transcriptional regulator [Nonomuraea deserti]|nr:BTAD domain-containing putative transcriptional regulator [Nonomuraea deserti]
MRRNDRAVVKPVRFSVLGPLSMARDGAKVPVPGGKIRILLAALLLRPNQAVPPDQLAGRLWGPNPPRNPRRVLQTNIVRLRQSLGLSEVIRTEPGGYLARLEPGQLDLLEFQRLVQQAADARTPELERRLLHEALALWNGPLCADVESDALHQIDVPPLVEQRLHTIERRLDLDLRLGASAALVPELRALTSDHPLRERFWAQLMTALHRIGRHSEALDTYRTVSRLLKEELGIDPNHELRELHQRILTQQRPIDEPRDDPADAEPGLSTLLRAWRERALLTQAQLAERTGLNVRTIRRLETGELHRPRNASMELLAQALDLSPAELSVWAQATGTSPQAPPPMRVTPRQLPADVGTFVGRTRELAGLGEVEDTADAADRDGREGATTVVISAIDGMAGVGKTALAVHAAHRIAPRFPDGNLFVDLHGFTRGMAPADPADTLARLLAALGVPGESIPQRLDDRAALYRSVLAERRMLIVLDNAADEAQVRPLLPGAGGCLVLVTSRRRLVGLDGASVVSLDVLAIEDAIALFTATAGQERVAGESRDALEELVRRCGLLPLAIRLAAARLKAHPSWTAQHLMERFEQHRHRLEELQTGERSVAAALDLSYRELDLDERRAYRLLGLNPGGDLAPDAAAALLDTSLAQATDLLDRLLEVHLQQEPVPGRYRFHDLIRAHAAERAGAEEPEPDRHAALTRLLDHYSHAASEAMDRLYPYEADMRPRLDRGRAPAMPDAADWLESELANLLSLARFAAEHGFRDHVRHLSATLHRCLRTRGRYAEAETLHERALAAARATGDRAGAMEALIGLAEIRYMLSRNDAALADHSAALVLARAIGDRAGELRALNGIGLVHLSRDDYGPAADHLTQALGIAREIGHRTGELDALIASGHVDRVMGEHQQSIDHLRQALGIARSIGHHTTEARALTGLGYIHLARDELEPAADYFVRARDLAGRTGYRVGELSSLTALGELHQLQGRHEQARDCYQQVADLAREIGSRNWQFEAIHGMGRLHHEHGDHEQALDDHRQALDLAAELDHPSDQARAHDGLAHACAALGRPDEARGHWTEALTILAKLGIDHTDERGVDAASISAHLAGLAHP